MPASRPRVLFLTHRLPYPPDRGDRIRTYHMLQFLSSRFDLDLGCTSDEPVWLQHHQLLATMAKRVGIQPTSASWGRVRALCALGSGASFTPAYYYRQGLADTILQWYEQQPFDAVLTSCTGMIGYARMILARAAAGVGPVKPRRLRHVVDLMDVDSLKWESYAKSGSLPLRWVYAAECRRLRRIESGTAGADRFDAVTLVSPNEAQAYRQSVGDHPGLTVVPNGVRTDYFHPLPDVEGKTVVFVGVLNYRPNVQGIVWFVRQVMPLLAQRVPDLQLQIVGRNPAREVLELGQVPGVEVVGSVPDVRDYLRKATAVIAPLLIARGVQNKVLEAMASRRAVISSPGAAQGIAATPGRDLLIADTPQQWTTHIQQVLSDTDQRQRLAEAGLQYVRENHSWEKCLEPLATLLMPPCADYP